MGTGSLWISATAAGDALPVAGARVTVTSENGDVLYRLVTGADGATQAVSLNTPDAAATLDPNYAGRPYAVYDVRVEHDNYKTKVIRGVKVWGTEEAILPVNMLPKEDATDGGGAMEPAALDDSAYVMDLSPHALVMDGVYDKQGASYSPGNTRVLPDVVFPEKITIHLGRKEETSAQNVTVPFIDYIKNVCTNEIYDTWPEEAIKANVYAQISLALNRVYTEWYPSQGYSYDITSSTWTDQNYVYGSQISKRISSIVEDVFKDYPVVIKEGHKEPYYTEYCDGVKADCPGMKQWGSVTLANQGMSALQILQYYYGKDTQIVSATKVGGAAPSFPGTLSVGSSGDSVRALQEYLNRIRVNYPNIPKIAKVDGVFGAETEAAVKAFQKQFGLAADGVVGKETWNKASYIYAAVKKLAELTGEGEIIGVTRTPPTVTLKQGDRGGDVGKLQHVLNLIADVYPEIPPVAMDYSFGADTTDAVKAFQKLFGLTPDGVVGPGTWERLYEVYWGIRDNMLEPSQPGVKPVYPGSPLRYGSSGEAVRTLQACLNRVAANNPGLLEGNTEDGYFGSGTEAIVIAFQRLAGLTADGVAGPATWDRVFEACSNNEVFGGGNTAYPGYAISQGATGAYVRQIQSCLNNVMGAGLAVDGSFGSGTYNAVVNFQRRYGLTADGVVGRQTWDKLMAECGAGPSVPPYPGSSLAYGSGGAAVMQVQQCLNNVMGAGLAVDGNFGSGTQTAVINFQKRYGLTADGVVGRQTWEKLMAECAGATGGGGVSSTYPGYAISQGAEGEYVRQIQSCLNNVAGAGLTVDGSFGSGTYNAVMNFQRRYGLTADGVVGKQTWDTLMAECGASGGVSAYPGSSLAYGASGAAVTQVQNCLNGVASKVSTITPVTADGKFGTATQNAVMAFQRWYGLTADGVVGRQTWDMLMAECGAASAGSSTYPGSALGYGSSGANVARIQGCLNNVSGKVSAVARVTVDGNYGTATQSAVKAFQRWFGLTADGVVGRQTWDRLMAECSAATASGYAAGDPAPYVYGGARGFSQSAVLRAILMSRGFGMR